MTATLIRPAPIQKRLELRATPEKAFVVFTEAMGKWWPKEHSIVLTLHQTPQVDVKIEPQVGGRWYEIGESGAEYQWGEVRAWEPPARLVLVWRLNAEFQYDPNLDTEVEVRFSPRPEGGTVVEFEHRGLEAFGSNAAEIMAGMDAGWGMILGQFEALAEA